MEITMIQAHTDVQKYDFEGDIPSEFDKIAALGCPRN